MWQKCWNANPLKRRWKPFNFLNEHNWDTSSLVSQAQRGFLIRGSTPSNISHRTHLISIRSSTHGLKPRPWTENYENCIMTGGELSLNGIFSGCTIHGDATGSDAKYRNCTIHGDATGNHAIYENCTIMGRKDTNARYIACTFPNESWKLEYRPRILRLWRRWQSKEDRFPLCLGIWYLFKIDLRGPGARILKNSCIK